MHPIKDSEKFFEIIQTTPDLLEAVDLIDRARAQIKDELDEAAQSGDTKREKACANTLTRLNREKKYINKIANEIQWHEAIRKTLGTDALNTVIAYKMQHFRNARDGG